LIRNGDKNSEQRPAESPYKNSLVYHSYAPFPFTADKRAAAAEQ